MVTTSSPFYCLFTIKAECEKCSFKKCTIKVCKCCSWQCPGTSKPGAAHLIVSLILCGSRSITGGESRALQGSGTWTRELLGATDKRSISPDKGVMYFPSRIINGFFSTKINLKKNWVSGQTWSGTLASEHRLGPQPATASWASWTWSFAGKKDGVLFSN